MDPTTSPPPEFVERLLHAVNTQDVDALTVCFAEDYVNATPAHPNRGFVGRAQVRSRVTVWIRSGLSATGSPRNRKRPTVARHRRIRPCGIVP